AGAKMGEVLRKQQVPYVEVLRTTTSTREVARALYQVAKSLAAPTDRDALHKSFLVWRRDTLESPDTLTAANLLKKLKHVEQYTAPRDKDWLFDTISQSDASASFELLEWFRLIVQRWQQATLLPIDQLLLTVAGDLFRDAAEIA